MNLVAWWWETWLMSKECIWHLALQIRKGEGKKWVTQQIAKIKDNVCDMVPILLEEWVNWRVVLLKLLTSIRTNKDRVKFLVWIDDREVAVELAWVFIFWALINNYRNPLIKWNDIMTSLKWSVDKISSYIEVAIDDNDTQILEIIWIDVLAYYFISWLKELRLYRFLFQEETSRVEIVEDFQFLEDNDSFVLKQDGDETFDDFLTLWVSNYEVIMQFMRIKEFNYDFALEIFRIIEWICLNLIDVIGKGDSIREFSWDERNVSKHQLLENLFSELFWRIMYLWRFDKKDKKLLVIDFEKVLTWSISDSDTYSGEEDAAFL